jgi:hypothetical protein
VKTETALAVTTLIIAVVVAAIFEVWGPKPSAPPPPDPNGSDCIMTYNRLQGDVFDSLSWHHQALLTGGGFSCLIQRDILDDLADAPKANRDEDFDREMDAIDEMRKAMKH